MARTQPFDTYSDEYDAWFDRHAQEYALELRALSELMPSSGKGLEIGVGTGKFAVPLQIAHGVDPSVAMITKARSLGVEVVQGVAEKLPYGDACFDFTLMVTTICFVDDLRQSFEEANRVLKHGGHLLLGFVDKESTLGQQYQARKNKSRFYASARFYATEEVLALLYITGFENIMIRQTLLPEGYDVDIMEGYGEGSFVALSATKGG